MARLLEYQGKDVLRRFNIPTPKGKVARSVQEAQVAARDIGYPLVVKAQVYAGKRGKSGGIRMVDDEDELLQLDANKRYWSKRLDQIRDELKTEPGRIQDLYSVVARRVEPVGLVYLWPVTG